MPASDFMIRHRATAVMDEHGRKAHRYALRRCREYFDAGDTVTGMEWSQIADEIGRRTWSHERLAWPLLLITLCGGLLFLALTRL